MARILFAWIGQADLNAGADKRDGPILSSILDASLALDCVWLLASWSVERIDAYSNWLAGRAPGVRIVTRPTMLTQPNAFAEIYRHASAVVAEALGDGEVAPELFFQASVMFPWLAEGLRDFLDQHGRRLPSELTDPWSNTKVPRESFEWSNILFILNRRQASNYADCAFRLRALRNALAHQQPLTWTDAVRAEADLKMLLRWPA